MSVLQTLLHSCISCDPEELDKLMCILCSHAAYAWRCEQVMGLVQGALRPQETSWTALMRDAVANMPATSTPVQAPQPRPAGLPVSQPPAWRMSGHPPPAPVPQHGRALLWIRHLYAKASVVVGLPAYWRLVADRHRGALHTSINPQPAGG